MNILCPQKYFDRAASSSSVLHCTPVHFACNAENGLEISHQRLMTLELNGQAVRNNAQGTVVLDVPLSSKVPLDQQK